MDEEPSEDTSWEIDYYKKIAKGIPWYEEKTDT